MVNWSNTTTQKYIVVPKPETYEEVWGTTTYDPVTMSVTLTPNSAIAFRESNEDWVLGAAFYFDVETTISSGVIQVWLGQGITNLGAGIQINGTQYRFIEYEGTFSIPIISNTSNYAALLSSMEGGDTVFIRLYDFIEKTGSEMLSTIGILGKTAVSRTETNPALTIPWSVDWINLGNTINGRIFVRNTTNSNITIPLFKRVNILDNKPQWVL